MTKSFEFPCLRTAALWAAKPEVFQWLRNANRWYFKQGLEGQYRYYEIVEYIQNEYPFMDNANTYPTFVDELVADWDLLDQ